MKVSNILHRKRHDLIYAVEKSVRYSMISAWQKVGGLPKEPHFIAEFVMEGVRRFALEWEAVLPSDIEFSVLSVFCHGSPMVSYEGVENQGSAQKGSCELGDLLLLYAHSIDDKVVIRQAILLQAKMADDPDSHIDKSDYHQLHLYEQWPGITYDRPKYLAGQKRWVAPNRPHNGAQYLLVGKDDLHTSTAHWHPCFSDLWVEIYGVGRPFSMTTAPAAQDLFSRSTLSREVYNLTAERSGRHFTDCQSAKRTTGWSRVVWDLLENALDRADSRGGFSQRKVGHEQESPIQGMGTLSDLDGATRAFRTSNAPLHTVREILGDRADNYYPKEGSSAEETMAEPSEVFIRLPREGRFGGGPPYGDEVGEPPDDGGGASVVLLETSETTEEA